MNLHDIKINIRKLNEQYGTILLYTFSYHIKHTRINIAGHIIAVFRHFCNVSQYLCRTQTLCVYFYINYNILSYNLVFDNFIVILQQTFSQANGYRFGLTL